MDLRRYSILGDVDVLEAEKVAESADGSPCGDHQGDQIEGAVSKIEVHGARYTEHLQQMVGR